MAKHYPATISKLQSDATLTQTSPVQNTWYTVLDTTRYVRIISAGFQVTTTSETLQWRITIDGRTLSSASVACTNDAHYYGYLYCDTVNSDLFCGLSNTVVAEQTRTFIIEGNSVKVEMRKTTATGSGNLRGRINYAVIEQ